MTQVPASSHGGGSSFPSTWTVETGGELEINPAAVGGVGAIVEARAGAAYSGGLLWLYEPSGFTALQVNNKGDIYASSNEPTTDALYVQPLVALNAGKNVAFFGPSSGNNKLRVSRNGYVVIDARAAPADAELAANECALWFDKTNGAAKLMLKGKTADGTVVTASIVLA